MKALGPSAFRYELDAEALLQGAARVGGDTGEDLADFAHDLAVIQNLPETKTARAVL